MSARPRLSPDLHDVRGQSLVEYAMTVPVFLIILLGILEFGFAFSHHMTMEYSTREGARTAAALNNGTDQISCNGLNDDNVDNQVIAAVQRVLTAAGSQVSLADVQSIHIYKASSTGKEPSIGSVNIWVPGASPSTVGGQQLLFNRTQHAWDACGRDNKSSGVSDPVDSVGVSMTYTYHFVTPLSSLLGLVGAGQLTMSDHTVMALNPDPV